MPISDDFNTKSQAFIEWLKANGAVISDKVAIHDYRESKQGRGVRANANIEKGEILFTLPRALVLTVDNNPGQIDEFFKSKGSPELTPWLALTAAMILNQKSDHWKPYWDVLPHQFDTLMFWTDDELKSMQGSFAIEQIGREEAEIDYRLHIEPLFRDRPDIDSSLEVFHRISSIIMAYSFDIPKRDEDTEEFEEDDGLIKAMVPLADTLNAHTKMCNARLSVSEKDPLILEVRAISDIPAGNQVYNWYGDLSNGDLLRRYGYVEEGGNDFDFVELSVPKLLSYMNISSECIKRCFKYLNRLDEENDFFLIDEEALEIKISGKLESDTITGLLLIQASMNEPETKVKTILKRMKGPSVTPELKNAWIRLLNEKLEEYGHPTGTEHRIQMARQIIEREREIINKSLEWINNVEVVDVKIAAMDSNEGKRNGEENSNKTKKRREK